jgi:uncharacterized membrane protein|tara:strand:+ start:83 stop:355 length:273 start_codon:yes stop_codon:yes gene_type:complete
MVIEIMSGILLTLTLVMGYVIWNLMTKTEMLEDWVEEFQQKIDRIQFDLKTIDDSGHFEADDEIGTIFEQIKEIINTLDELKGEDVDATN